MSELLKNELRENFGIMKSLLDSQHRFFTNLDWRARELESGAKRAGDPDLKLAAHIYLNTIQALTRALSDAHYDIAYFYQGRIDAEGELYLYNGRLRLPAGEGYYEREPGDKIEVWDEEEGWLYGAVEYSNVRQCERPGSAVPL